MMFSLNKTKLDPATVTGIAILPVGSGVRGKHSVVFK